MTEKTTPAPISPMLGASPVVPCTTNSRPGEQKGQSRRRLQKTDIVEPCDLLLPLIRHEAQDETEADDADRDIDQEVPVPAQIGGDEAAEHRADDGRRQRRPGDHRHGVHQIGFARILQHDDAADGRHERTADALNGAGNDEFGEIAREAAKQRSHGEDGDRRQEYPPCAIAITRPAGQRHEGGHGEQIDRDADAHRHRLDAEGLRHLRQGRGDDRAVQDLHEKGDGDDKSDDAGLPAESCFGKLFCGPGNGHDVKFGDWRSKEPRIAGCNHTIIEYAHVSGLQSHKPRWRHQKLTR